MEDGSVAETSAGVAGEAVAGVAAGAGAAAEAVAGSGAGAAGPSAGADEAGSASGSDAGLGQGVAPAVTATESRSAAGRGQASEDSRQGGPEASVEGAWDGVGRAFRPGLRAPTSARGHQPLRPPALSRGRSGRWKRLECFAPMRSRRARDRSPARLQIVPSSKLRRSRGGRAVARSSALPSSPAAASNWPPAASTSMRCSRSSIPLGSGSGRGRGDHRVAQDGLRAAAA
jgi:hypothetical protein